MDTWRSLRVANSSCFDHQEKIFDEVIPSIDPDIVILSSRPVDDPRNGVPLIDQDAGALEQGSQAEQSSLRTRITDLIRDLRADGREVIIVEPIPVPEAGNDPLVCLSDAKFLETCRFVVPTNPSPEERIIRDVAGLMTASGASTSTRSFARTCQSVTRSSTDTSCDPTTTMSRSRSGARSSIRSSSSWTTTASSADAKHRVDSESGARARYEVPERSHCRRATSDVANR